MRSLFSFSPKSSDVYFFFKLPAICGFWLSIRALLQILKLSGADYIKTFDPSTNVRADEA